MFALRLRSWKWWIVGVGFCGLEDCVLRALGGHEIAGLNHMSGGRHAGRRMGKRRHTLPSGWFGILRLRSFLLRWPRTASQASLQPARHPNSMLLIGCTSQIVGIRLFKLGGPGAWPVLCVASKKSEPSITTGIGGW